jgi:hypothetical protein
MAIVNDNTGPGTPEQQIGRNAAMASHIHDLQRQATAQWGVMPAQAAGLDGTCVLGGGSAS